MEEVFEYINKRNAFTSKKNSYFCTQILNNHKESTCIGSSLGSERLKSGRLNSNARRGSRPSLCNINLYSKNMTVNEINQDLETQWYAIRTPQVFKTAETIAPHCEEIFLPTEKTRANGRRPRLKATIPHVMFIKTTHDKALRLESDARNALLPVKFWIYRYPKDNKIQPIPERTIDLLRLLTANDETKCEIYNKQIFNPRDHVRITDGMFKGYQGYVKRVRKNLHVIVEIEGICMVMLPYIHPDLLEKLP